MTNFEEQLDKRCPVGVVQDYGRPRRVYVSFIRKVAFYQDLVEVLPLKIHLFPTDMRLLPLKLRDQRAESIEDLDLPMNDKREKRQMSKMSTRDSRSETVYSPDYIQRVHLWHFTWVTTGFFSERLCAARSWTSETYCASDTGYLSSRARPSWTKMTFRLSFDLFSLACSNGRSVRVANIHLPALSISI